MPFPCCPRNGKVCYPGRKEAALAMRSLAKKHANYKGNVYLCAICQCYHIGRQKLGDRKNPKRRLGLSD